MLDGKQEGAQPTAEEEDLEEYFASEGFADQAEYIFSEYDKDGSGSLDVSELVAPLRDIRECACVFCCFHSIVPRPLVGGGEIGW